MKVSLLYLGDCPNWQVADARLAEALRLSGHADQQIEHVLVTSDEQAQDLRFVGSPTVLIDGADPFTSDEAGAFGLTCRVYRSAAGLAGSPTTDELVAAIAVHGEVRERSASGAMTRRRTTGSGLAQRGPSPTE